MEALLTEIVVAVGINDGDANRFNLWFIYQS